MTLQTEGLEKLQACLSNAIDWEKTRDRHLTAIIGDTPSKYAKSPTVWNAAFEALNLPAIFLPFDVAEESLETLVQAMREEPRLLGFSVTVPYKVKIIPLLDALDPKAKAIGAVNTVVRTKDGRLVGYNTDGQGGMDTLLAVPADGASPLFRSLENATVLLIGAGGAARALSFYLAESLGKGKLLLANRDPKKAETLCRDVNVQYRNAEFLPEKDIPQVARKADLIINATTKGQQGLRRLPDGTFTCLEPYSALAPADPPALLPQEENVFFSKWMPRAHSDILANQKKSLEILLNVPPKTLLFDIIYAPLETVFLRQGRWTGHRTLNGKTMNIAQAADAFCRKVLKEILRSNIPDPEEAYQRIFRAMAAKW